MGIKKQLSDVRLHHFQSVKTVEGAFNILKQGGAVNLNGQRMFVDYGGLSLDDIMYGLVTVPDTKAGLHKKLKNTNRSVAGSCALSY